MLEEGNFQYSKLKVSLSPAQKSSCRCTALTGNNLEWQWYPAGCVQLVQLCVIYTGPHYRLYVLVIVVLLLLGYI